MSTTEETKAPVWVTRLELDNWKRIRVSKMAIAPGGRLVMIGGRNRQGKSSILDAIEALAVGPKATPPDPIHSGKLSAKTKMHLGNAENPKQYVVERKYAHGKETLTLLGPDGLPIESKKQTTLDELFHPLVFEVSRFLRMKTADQDKLLKEAAGLDFTSDDLEYDKVFKARTVRNAELVRVKSRVGGLERIDDAPKKEDSSAAILAELEAADAREVEIRNANAELSDIAAGSERERARVVDLQLQIERLQHEVAALEQSIVLRADKYVQKQDALGALEPIDKAPIKARLEALEENNRKVRHNAEIDKLEAEQTAVEEEIERMTAQLDEIKATKAQKLADAKFPVPGLGFDETGPTLNGFPLEQASKREQLELCCALALQMQPQLRVFLVRDAAVIDDEGLAALAEFAERYECQIWLEVIAKEPAAGIVFIDDGVIVDPPVEGASA
jgi:AAA15 family ATPase/GTPase